MSFKSISMTRVPWRVIWHTKWSIFILHVFFFCIWLIPNNTETTSAFIFCFYPFGICIFPFCLLKEKSEQMYDDNRKKMKISFIIKFASISKDYHTKIIHWKVVSYASQMLLNIRIRYSLVLLLLLVQPSIHSLCQIPK